MSLLESPNQDAFVYSPATAMCKIIYTVKNRFSEFILPARFLRYTRMQLLSGGNYDIDADDLKNNTRYTGGYNEGSRTIKIFWEVIKGFEPKERCMLLKFVTSCSRAPLLGFKYLHPPFTIHKVACDVPLWATIGGQDVDRLPSASTCYNTLKLPTYKRPGTLRAKLLYAISSNAGFELS